MNPQLRTPDSLSLGLAGAAGVSNGAALYIPALLLPQDVAGRKLTALASAERLPDERVDGVEVYRIRGMHGNYPMTLWIDKSTLLVRKIESLNVMGQDTITYTPAINGLVYNEAVAFNPPR